MHPRKLPPERPDARTLLAMAALLLVGLAGCATEPTQKSDPPSAARAPYVGVFTGEFVEGKPLYRFPTIEVVGSRRGVVGASSEPDRGTVAMAPLAHR